MSTIKSSTTNTTAYQVVADTTGTLVFQTGATPTTALTISTAQVATLVSDAVVNGLTVGRGGAGGVANTAYGASAIPIAPNSGVTAIGSNAGKLFNTASDTGQSTFVGYFAGAQVSTGTDSTFVGGSAGTNTTTGAKNTAVGSQALQLNTTASNNTAVGYQAGYANTTGIRNTVTGSLALATNSTASFNSAFGYAALNSSTGSANTAVGSSALEGNTTASNNTAVGYQAGYTNVTGSYNTFMGVSAGRLSNYNGNAFNAAYGYASGYNLSTGINNSFYGTNSGSEVTTGSKNTIIGNYNGNQGSLDIRTASNAIVLSDGDGNPRLYRPSSGGWVFAGQTDGYDSIKCLVSGTNPYGINVDFTAADPNNTTNYVFGAYDSFASVWMYRIYSNGTVAARSDARWKKNIETTRNGYAEDLSRLRVVKYNWYNHEDGAPKELGFIAQEVEQVFPNLVQTDPVMKKREVTDELGNITEEEYQDGNSKSIKTSVFIPMLVKAIQELKAEVDSLKAQINGASA